MLGVVAQLYKRPIVAGKYIILGNCFVTPILKTLECRVDYVIILFCVLELVGKRKHTTLIALAVCRPYFGFGLIVGVVLIGDSLQFVRLVVMLLLSKSTNLGELVSRWDSLLLLQTSSMRLRGHADGDEEGRKFHFVAVVIKF